jgi:predicted HTH domain antitoxin
MSFVLVSQHVLRTSKVRGQPAQGQVIRMPTVTIEVPDDTFVTLHRSAQELGREMRLAAAMVWYTQGRISHEKAAHFAGVSRIDLIDALAAAKLPAFPVDVDELMEEVERARQAIREHVAPGVAGASGSAGDPEGRGQ